MSTTLLSRNTGDGSGVVKVTNGSADQTYLISLLDAAPAAGKEVPWAQIAGNDSRTTAGRLVFVCSRSALVHLGLLGG